MEVLGPYAWLYKNKGSLMSFNIALQKHVFSYDPKYGNNKNNDLLMSLSQAIEKQLWFMPLSLAFQYIGFHTSLCMALQKQVFSCFHKHGNAKTMVFVCPLAWHYKNMSIVMSPGLALQKHCLSYVAKPGNTQTTLIWFRQKLGTTKNMVFVCP